MSEYYVYIMASKGLVLYIGMTNDLLRRVFEHKNHLVDGFTSKYNVDRLVFYEATTDVAAAIQREKQLKGWRREKKIGLIEKLNPRWQDLAENWGKLPPRERESNMRELTRDMPQRYREVIQEYFRKLSVQDSNR